MSITTPKCSRNCPTRRTNRLGQLQVWLLRSEIVGLQFGPDHHVPVRRCSRSRPTSTTCKLTRQVISRFANYLLSKTVEFVSKDHTHGEKREKGLLESSQVLL